MEEYEIFYPGQYNEHDKKILEQHKKDWDACGERGEIDIDALIAGRLDPATPGLSRRILHITDWETCLFAQNFDADNQLYFDPDYAKARGYKDKIVMQTHYAFDGAFFAAMPTTLSDGFYVSGLTHSFTFYRPVYAGDTLYPLADKRTFEDITPAEGSRFRTFSISGSGRLLNQNGEVVAAGESHVKESLLRHADPALQTPDASSPRMNPDWWGDRPAHKYTDEDWAQIRAMWAKEKVRGDEPLYWEDVKVGDRPPITADGPIVPQDLWNFHSVGSAHGMYFRNAMNGSGPFTPTLARHAASGLYCNTGFSHTSDGIDSDFRAGFFNFVGANVCNRMLTNWIGNKGWIQNISWNIMQTLAGVPDVPDYPDGFPGWLNRVPEYRNYKLATHGMQNDMMITRSMVVDKYEKNGAHFVDLVWWIETIDNVIYQQGAATVKLPVRG